MTRHRSASTMQVHLAASEAEEAAADPAFRARLLDSMRAAARAKGRLWVELLDQRGVLLERAAS